MALDIIGGSQYNFLSRRASINNKLQYPKIRQVWKKICFLGESNYENGNNIVDLNKIISTWRLSDRSTSEFKIKYHIGRMKDERSEKDI